MPALPLSRLGHPVARAAMALALLATIALTLAACSDREDGAASATPGGPVADGELPLFAARRDLAQRVALPVVQVGLGSLVQTGWDGCLGIRTAGRACAELFGAGLIAWFEAAGHRYRYHIFGQEIYATDFIGGATIDDGLPLMPELRTDLNAVLAEYARLDLELRTLPGARVEAIVPTYFGDGCLGYQPRGGGACTGGMGAGAIVLVAASDGLTYRYHVAPALGVLPAFPGGFLIARLDQPVVDLQTAMRRDLAGRLAVPLERVSVQSFREVTWPDGCAGISRPGQLCTQALVAGFLAVLAGPDGQPHRYHGANGEFVAASFLTGVTLTEPFVE